MVRDKKIRVAILDLYEGAPNQGMRCIRDIVRSYCREHNFELTLDEFEVRLSKRLPGLDYDIYISSGGPGSPIESKGSDWENLYFSWISQIESYNTSRENTDKKYVLFICHSFQLACRYFEVGLVSKRKSTAFGVFPVHLIEEGKQEPIFTGLDDPFYAVDSRDYQVIQPDYERLENMGATVLAIEKERPHIPLERAIMAIRFNDYMLGTQFHPEADAEGMSMYLQREDRKEIVIENHGFEKWKSMIDQLNDPEKIVWTYSHVIPNFLASATAALYSTKF
jgi:GMP synthase-like glutamine amidotransferase